MNQLLNHLLLAIAVMFFGFAANAAIIGFISNCAVPFATAFIFAAVGKLASVNRKS